MPSRGSKIGKDGKFWRLCGHPWRGDVKGKKSSKGLNAGCLPKRVALNQKGGVWICTGRRKHILMEKGVTRFSSKTEHVPWQAGL